MNDGFGAVTSRDDAVALVADGIADSVAVGRRVIANPTWSSADGTDTPRT